MVTLTKRNKVGVSQGRGVLNTVNLRTTVRLWTTHSYMRKEYGTL